MVEILTKENEKVLDESTKIIQTLDKSILEMTEKDEKLHDEVTNFMVEFWCSSDQSTENGNKVITSLGTTMQTEKEALPHYRYEIQVDNSKLNASVVFKDEKHQKDLATENNLTDKLAQKNEKAKVLLVKLNYTNKCLDDLKLEKTVIKSCVS